MKKEVLLFSLLATLLVCVLFPFAIGAQETAQNAAQDAAVTHSLVLQSSSLIEVKLGYTFNYKFPFMQGDSPLTEGNNINLELTAEVSPVSLKGLATVIWTPIAFLEFSAGGMIATGWSIDIFGSRIYGLAITQADFRYPPMAVDLLITERGGMIGKALLGGAFQFDLAAIFPGDWNHILFKTYHEINYAGYNKVISGGPVESWIFENDDGENRNGFKYRASYLIGYQIPFFLNIVAFMAEAELPLYDNPFPPCKSDWGGDLAQWTFSGALFFVINKQFDIMLATQFRTRKNYMESDWERYYYRNLTIDSSNPRRIEFYRVAAIVTYKF